MVLIPNNLKLSQTSLTLLTRLRSKELTIEQFLRECAYWAIKEGFDEIQPLHYPTPPNTQAFYDYQALPPFRKVKVEQTFFDKYPEILEYYRQCFWVKHRNKTHLDWLKEIQTYILEDDTLTLQKIDDRIFEFDAWFDGLTEEAEKIKKIFEGKEAL